MMKKTLFLAFVLALSTATAMAHSYQQGAIRIGHVWARATPNGATVAAIYLPLLNTGDQPDSLTGATSDNAARIEIHQMTDSGGVMKMTRLDALPLDPGQPVALSPGGAHLMVFGLKQPLKQGDMFPLTLQFAKAGSAKVEAMIVAQGAMSGDSH